MVKTKTINVDNRRFLFSLSVIIGFLIYKVIKKNSISTVDIIPEEIVEETETEEPIVDSRPDVNLLNPLFFFSVVIIVILIIIILQKPKRTLVVTLNNQPFETEQRIGTLVVTLNNQPFETEHEFDLHVNFLYDKTIVKKVLTFKNNTFYETKDEQFLFKNVLQPSNKNLCFSAMMKNNSDNNKNKQLGVFVFKFDQRDWSTKYDIEGYTVLEQDRNSCKLDFSIQWIPNTAQNKI
jgi:hypothetical protein